MTPSNYNEETVRLAFRMILGREVESDRTIDAHLGFGSVEQLGRVLIESKEFRSKSAMPHLDGSKWVATDVLDRYIMWVDLHDRYVSRGCLLGGWETEETEFFESRLHEGQTVLDIGANLGWFTLVAAGKIGSSGKVHAFEPHPVSSGMLARTISMNQLNSVVELWDYALSDSAGELTLHWAENNENPGHSFLSRSPSAIAGHESARVRTARLDDLLPEVAPDVVKIDVEGAEPMVIAGALQALRRKKPVILSELFPEQLMSVSGVTTARYIEQMEGEGYGCYLLEKGVLTDRLRDYPSGYPKELASVVFEPKGSSQSTS